jgi:hypothetical protein
MTWIGEILLAVLAVAIVAAFLAKPKAPEPPDDIYTLY